MKKTNFIILVVLGVLMLNLFGCGKNEPISDDDFVDEVKTDDWVYSPENYTEYGSMTKSITMAAPSGAMDFSGAVMEESIGFSTGGAKDINNFRENIKNSFLPLFTDLTYEGLFYDYYFDTGKKEECKKLFCPSYSYAVSKDPFSEDEDYYLSVGLNSGIKESDFERKKLNLVVVVDISGSMSSSFDTYYYDQFGNQVPFEGAEENSNKSKMEVANESVNALLDHLNPSDRFGMVLFDDYAYLAKPMNFIGKSDVDKLKEHISDIIPMNGTYMEAGMNSASDLFKEYKDIDKSEYENRIIFLTDAMPNIGETDDNELYKMFKENAENNIYTTFIGIGVDFNTELIEAVTKVKGANYYSVHSAKEFKTRMDDEFEYMVTPLVFDLELKLEADGYEISKVYGSPEASEATGEIMKVNTLFPSKTEGGETRGGVVLLKLKKTGSDEGNITLTASYEDRNGKKDSDAKEIVFGDEEADYYENNGIRKAVLLTRYADLIKDWINDERASYGGNSDFVPLVTYEKGIIIPPMPPDTYSLNEWERQSMDLTVSKHYKDLFKDFRKYFADELDEISDDTLSQELDVLDLLISAKSSEWIYNDGITVDIADDDDDVIIEDIDVSSLDEKEKYIGLNSEILCLIQNQSGDNSIEAGVRGVYSKYGFDPDDETFMNYLNERYKDEKDVKDEINKAVEKCI